MKEVDSDSVLPPDFKRIHFVKVERITKDDAIKYHLKNHFNAPILQVDGKQTGSQVNLEFVDTRARAGKSKGEDPITFSRACIKKLDSSYIVQNDGSTNMVCDLMSTEGKQLLRIVAEKDKSSSTWYDYKALKTAKEREALFQINRRKVGSGQSEITIGLLTSKGPTSSVDSIIARINFNEGNVCLSMAPELEMATKARLIGIAILLEVLENRQIRGVS